MNRLHRAFDSAEAIETEFVHPPIPDRQFDYRATRRGYEPGDLMGYGRTEQAAIDDLLAQEQDEMPEDETPWKNTLGWGTY